MSNERKDYIETQLEPLVQIRGTFRERPFNWNLRVFFKRRIFPQVEQNLDEGVKTIILYSSLQGGGKTRVRRIGEKVVEKAFPGSKSATATVTYTQEAPKLREAGIITTGPLDERKDEELDAMGLAARLKLVETLKRDEIEIIHGEFAIINGIPLRVQGRFVGRDIGGKTFDYLLQDNPHLPPYGIVFVGLNVGPIQEKEGFDFRNKVKHATGLEAIQQVCLDFDVDPIPQTAAEAIAVQLDGASPATMQKLYGALPDLAKAVIRERVGLQTPSWMRGVRPTGMRTLYENYQNMVRQNLLFEYYRYLLGDCNPHIQKDNFFHGFSERPHRYT